MCFLAVNLCNASESLLLKHMVELYLPVGRRKGWNE
jgi:hypothetical protein